MELNYKNCQIFLKESINRREMIELRKILLKGYDMNNFDGEIEKLDYETLEKYKEKGKEIIIEKIGLKDSEIFNKNLILDYLYDEKNLDDKEYLDLEKQINIIISGKKKY